MRPTEANLQKEQTRARREHTPAQIKRCRKCKQIWLRENFTESGAKKGICRVCSRKDLERWKEAMLDGFSAERANLSKRRYHALRARALKKGRSVCMLDEFADWFERAQEEGICFYCQGTLDFVDTPSLSGATVDRMDNDEGYEVANIALSCRRCNLIKGSWFSVEEMLSIAEKYLVDRDYPEKAKERQKGEHNV